MAFAQDMSCECTKFEFDLFFVPPTQISIEHGSWVEYYPVTTVNESSPIEVDISRTEGDYIDFANTILHVKAKITQNDGTNLLADVATGPANLLFTACFRRWTFHSTVI